MPKITRMRLAMPFILLLAGAVVSCSLFQSKHTREMQEKVYYAGPPTFVYKTKKDYYYNVPVMLSDDKKSITAFPAPSDLMMDGKFLYPEKMHKGYLLDRKGIGMNVAFLTYTYEEYAALKEVPAAGELYKKIADADPLDVLYNLGSRYQFENLTDTVNKIIDAGDLKIFKKLK